MGNSLDHVNDAWINRPLLTTGFQEKNYVPLIFDQIVAPSQLQDIYEKSSNCVVNLGFLTLTNARNLGRNFTPRKRIEVKNKLYKLGCIYEDYRNLSQSRPIRIETQEKKGYDLRYDRYTYRGIYRWDNLNQINSSCIEIDQILTQEFLDRYLLPSLDLINYRASQKVVERYNILKQNPYSPTSSWFW